jgi:HSP20 family molecular chaperone IbpA
MLPVRRRGYGGWNSLLKDFDDLASTFEIFDDTVRYSIGEDRVFELEVPGFNETNLDVEFANGILTVKGTREVKEEGCYAGRREIYKRYTVGPHENVDASVKDGILKLTLKPSKEDVKKIDLKSE